MGAAYFIVSEEPIEGFDVFVDGKALAHASDQLDALAEAAGVRPLMDFFSMDPEEVDAIFDDLLAAEGEFGDLEADLDDDEEEDPVPKTAGPNGTASTPPSPDAPDTDHPLAESLASIAAEETPPEEWYTAAEGLTTVHALIAAVEKLPEPTSPDPAPSDDPPPSAILTDLRAFAAVLDHLQAANIRWHLAVDF